jgi:hypothetical protein
LTISSPVQGIKFFALADDSGYVYKFWIYEGAEEAAKSGLSAKPFDVVKGLIDIVPKDDNYIIFADSFYGSFPLAKALAEEDFLFILACRGDRSTEHFNGYLATALGKGKWPSMHNDELGILATSFHDTKKVLNVISLRSDHV